MALSIERTVERCATWPVALAALFGAIGSAAGLAWRQTRLGGMELLDTRGWYTPDDVAALFTALDRLDASALDIYAITALTIDMRLPVC